MITFAWLNGTDRIVPKLHIQALAVWPSVLAQSDFQEFLKLIILFELRSGTVDATMRRIITVAPIVHHVYDARITYTTVQKFGVT